MLSSLLIGAVNGLTFGLVRPLANKEAALLQAAKARGDKVTQISVGIGHVGAQLAFGLAGCYALNAISRVKLFRGVVHVARANIIKASPVLCGISAVITVKEAARTVDAAREGAWSDAVQHGVLAGVGALATLKLSENIKVRRRLNRMQAAKHPVTKPALEQMHKGFNADHWSQTRLAKGQRIHVLVGSKQSEVGSFSFANHHALTRLGSVRLHEQLQICPRLDKVEPFRKTVRTYEFTKVALAWTAQALANPRCGAGGGYQLFTEDLTVLAPAGSESIRVGPLLDLEYVVGIAGLSDVAVMAAKSKRRTKHESEAEGDSE